MHRITQLAGATLLFTALFGTAQADELSQIDELSTEGRTSINKPFADAAKVTDSSLHTIAGKADLSQGVLANNSSNVSNNSVEGTSVTGTINLDNSAFRDMRGLSVLSANTGNNVSINSSMNVNVAIRQ